MSLPADSWALIQGYLDGTLSEADFALFQARLRDEPVLRRALRDLATVDAKLQDQAAQVPFPGEILVATGTHAVESVSERRAVPGRVWVLGTLLASLALAAVWWVFDTNSYATVYQGIGVSELTAGSSVGRGQHVMEAGAVELITTLGVRVVIEAPATFEFTSAQRLHLTRGRISADVPPQARGFTVITPTGNAVDLGTKFGVDVPTQGAAEIHVFEGEVIAEPKGSAQRHSLRHGEAMALQQGASGARELRSAAFIQPEELSALGTGTAQRRLQSDAALETLRRDPAAIAVLDFEGGSLPEGKFHLAQGRWPGTRAPEFVNLGDHMRLDVGGGRSWPQVTLAAWVRIDRLGSPYQSLYHTDGWEDDKPGQLHWMITQATTMRLAARHTAVAPDPVTGERQAFPDSLRPVLPERGRWMHLVVVSDEPGRQVRFYVNGELDRVVPLAKALPALLGPAQIGNWNSKDRRLSGRVDEFIMMGRALSDAEIRALHRAGNPYR